MVCIAAFIILALIGIFVAIISIFKPEVGKNYWKMFKKAWGCLWKKVRLQKCETGFKEDVKNTILSKVIIKHPTWVKPLSILMEVISAIIVAVAVWALLTAIKSLLALWALGSCNVTKPSACSLGAEVCSIDEEEPSNFFEATGRWFTEWGEIFEAIPDKFRTYNGEEYGFSFVMSSEKTDLPVAVDIFDPGCSVCLSSYLNQKKTGFFDKYNVRLVPFAIQDADDTYKFRNSEIAVRYILAANEIKLGLGAKVIDYIFTESYMVDQNNPDSKISFQSAMNEVLTSDEVIRQIETWMKTEGLTDEDIGRVKTYADSEEATAKMNENRRIVENELRIKGIPTIIYDGKKHTGLFKE